MRWAIILALFSLTPNIMADTPAPGSVSLHDRLGNFVTTTTSGSKVGLDVNIANGSISISVGTVSVSPLVNQGTGGNSPWLTTGTLARSWLLSSSDQVTALQGGAPWSFNLTELLGSAPSATNPLAARITNGTSYVDPTQIRSLSSITDSVTAVITGSPTVTANAGSGTFQTNVTNPITISSGTVTISNPSSSLGTVAVSNFPPVQVTSGTVQVGNFPAIQQVTQLFGTTSISSIPPLSGTFAVSNFPVVQVVSGTTAVSNFPLVQGVSGTVGISGTTSVALVPGASISVVNFPNVQTVDGTVDVSSLPPVVVSNFPSVQVVSGTTQISNFPASQTVNGTVTALQGTSPWLTLGTQAISNFPSVQVVSGTTQVSNFPATQNVQISGGTSLVNQGTSPWISQITTGTVAVSNFPATQNVSGTVSITGGTIGISGTVPVSLSALPIGTVAVNNFPTVQVTSGTQSISNFPAVQVVSGTTSISGPVSLTGGTVGALQVGTWTTGRTWSLSNSTDSVLAIGTLGATQSGTWTVGLTGGTVGISGPVSLTGGTVGALQVGTWTTGRTWSLGSSTDSILAIGTLGSTQSGTWTVGLTGGTVGALQVGTWTTGRTWSLGSSTDSILAIGTLGATQSGTWTVGMTGGTVGVPGVSTATNQTNGSQKTQIVDGSGTTIGPASTINGINYLPVINQQDFALAGGNITVQDTASTTTSGFANQSQISGTPTTNSTVSASLNSVQAVMVEISGTWTGTLAVEVSSNNGTTWVPRGVHVVGTSTFASQITSNVVGSLNSTAKTNVRVRAVSAMTGTAAISYEVSDNVSNVYVANSISLVDGSQTVATNKLTIKSATTAAGTLDTSAVVALSPNSPIPPGANTIGFVKLTDGTSAATIQSTTGQQNVAIPTLTTSGTISATCLDASINSCGANTTVPIALLGATNVEVSTPSGNWSGGAIGIDVSYDNQTTWLKVQSMDGQIGTNFNKEFTAWGSSLIADPWIANVAGATHARLRSQTAITGTIGVSIAATHGAQNVLMTPTSLTYFHVNTAGTTTVKSGPVRVQSVCINTKNANGDTLTMFDNTTNAAPTVAVVTLGGTTIQNCLTYGQMLLGTGLTVTTTGTSDWTITYQ